MLKLFKCRVAFNNFDPNPHLLKACMVGYGGGKKNERGRKALVLWDQVTLGKSRFENR